MIAADKSNKENQTPSAAKLKNLFETSENYVDSGVTGTDEPCLFEIPIIPRTTDNKTPF